MIDARRMEVYCQVFDYNLTATEPMNAKVIEAQSFEDYLSRKPVIFFGSGAEKCRTVIRHTNAIFMAGITPSAAELGQIIYPKYRKGLSEDLVLFAPIYLKEFFVKKPLLDLNESK
jgi:tRNA threonylcarbamoyladenosine biosynthesis protein TsaB